MEGLGGTGVGERVGGRFKKKRTQNKQKRGCREK